MSDFHCSIAEYNTLVLGCASAQKPSVVETYSGDEYVYGWDPQFQCIEFSHVVYRKDTGKVDGIGRRLLTERLSSRGVVRREGRKFRAVFAVGLLYIIRQALISLPTALTAFYERYEEEREANEK